jgi:hypothetical protein
MAILKHTISGTSLVEVIVALSLISFLFGATAWFFVSMNQSKYVHRNARIIQLLLDEEANVHRDEHSLADDPYTIEMHSTEISDVLSESTLYLLHKKGDTVYQFSTLKIQ